MKNALALFGGAILFLAIASVIIYADGIVQISGGNTTIGTGAATSPGTPWTNGMTFAGVASNSSVTFVDGANAKVVISNGVIGTVKAITNSANIETATLDSTGNSVVLGTFNVGVSGTSRSASFPAVGGNSSVIIGDVDGQVNSTSLTVNDNSSTITLSASSGVSVPVGALSGNGSGLTSLNAANISSGILNQNRFSLTNFTSYAAGTAYTYTGIAAQLAFGTTSPGVTINQAGTYLIMGGVGMKFNSATYAGAQSVTNKFRRTNNTAADITGGNRVTELPVLTTFTGGQYIEIPKVIYTATSGDIIQIFGAVTATPSAGSVTADSAEIVCLRIY